MPVSTLQSHQSVKAFSDFVETLKPLSSGKFFHKRSFLGSDKVEYTANQIVQKLSNLYKSSDKQKERFELLRACRLVEEKETDPCFTALKNHISPLRRIRQIIGNLLFRIFHFDRHEKLALIKQDALDKIGQDAILDYQESTFQQIKKGRFNPHDLNSFADFLLPIKESGNQVLFFTKFLEVASSSLNVLKKEKLSKAPSSPLSKYFIDLYASNMCNLLASLHLKYFKDEDYKLKVIASQSIELLKAQKPRSLDLNRQDLNDDDLQELTELKHLESITGLNGEGITPAGFAQLLKFKSLKRLDASKDNLSDADLEEIFKLKSLQSLRLSKFSEVTSKGLKQIASLENLESLNIYNCPIGLKEAMEADLPKLLKLKDLSITWSSYLSTKKNKKAFDSICEKIPSLDKAQNGPDSYDVQSLVKKLLEKPMTFEDYQKIAIEDMIKNDAFEFSDMVGRFLESPVRESLSLKSEPSFKEEPMGKITQALFEEYSEKYCQLLFEGYLLEEDQKMADRIFEVLKAANPRALVSSRNLKEAHSRISELKSLESFKIRGAEVAEIVFDKLSELPKLKSLDISSYDLSDATISKVSKIQSLESFEITADDISPKGFESLATLTNLKSLTFNGLRVTAAHLEELSKLKGLESLKIDFRALTDVGVEFLAKLNLKSLVGSHICDSDLAKIAACQTLTSLKCIDSHGSEITDSGLESIGKLANLECLRLDSNGFAFEKVEEHLSKLKKLERLTLPVRYHSMNGEENLKKAIPSLKKVRFV